MSDFCIRQCTVVVVRSGVARYEMRVQPLTGTGYLIKLWTSLKGHIHTRLDIDFVASIPPWLRVTGESVDELEMLEAKECSFHLEHMDRGHYWLGITGKNGQHATIDFTTRGYLKTSIEKIGGA